MTIMNPSTCISCGGPVPPIGTIPPTTRLYFVRNEDGNDSRLCGQTCYLAAKAAQEAHLAAVVASAVPLVMTGE